MKLQVVSIKDGSFGGPGSLRVYERRLSARLTVEITGGKLRGRKQHCCCFFPEGANQTRAIEAAKLQQLIGERLMAYRALFHGNTLHTDRFH